MAARVLGLLAAALVVVTAGTNTSKHGGHESHRADKAYIINGKPAEPDQFPYMAALDDFDRYICGGSLISRTSVLTAAHCIKRSAPLRIRLGTVLRSQPWPTAWITVSHWFKVHPKFNPTLLNNDVAIIMLGQMAPLSKHIWPVTLPSSTEISNDFEGTRAIVSGWGWYCVGMPCPERLQWTTAAVISNKMCSSFYKPGEVIESTLCTNDYYYGACYGDSGSPLVLKTARDYKQIGIVSNGPTNCELGVPRTYTRVTSFLGWITRTDRMRK